MLEKTFVSYLSDSITKNWDIPALADYNGKSFTYREIGASIIRFHKLFNELGINPGEKVAIVGKNSARWGILYLSIVTYGAVVVPVFPDFKANDLKGILDHSDSVLLFADEKVIETIDCSDLDKLYGILKIDDYSLLKCKTENLTNAYEKSELGKIIDATNVKPSDLNLPEIPNDNLAVLSYTSGTSGFTKGVMLAHNSLAANIRFAQNNMPLKAGDSIVSLLPMAHTFGCAFEFLFPFTLGCHVTILTKTPSPQIIMKAFQEIKPALILSVPLIIEKIYKNKLLPVLGKWHIKLLLSMPGVNRLILNKFKAQLTTVFGGNFHEIVMGGAPLNQEAEMFFRRMKFKYTVGYGMTECGPLISYNSWRDLPAGSSGKMVDTLEVKIDKESPEKLAGEICVRGENVMDGYYKSEEDTRKVIDEDGWLHTGDLGYVDEKGFIYIKGRSKSMILGANGKNIYPEEIESILNNRHAVAESVVVHRNDKLVAMVFPDADVVKKEDISNSELLKIFEHHRKALNHKLPKYMNVSTIELHPEEFVKTPKRSIKRYLYN
ncbi:MAG: long-chain fatty acid--CoA ligase [Deltaproteobacteria bacterium]|nr:MAG: long-chain fatty acid--CoA ligase [Deltaproteobacteria bacterium]